MRRKRKFLIWLSVFLSLPLLALASEASREGNETPVTAEEVRPPTGTNPQYQSALGAEFRKIGAWLAGIERANQQEAARQALLAAQRAQWRQAQRHKLHSASSATATPLAGSGRCGGDLPPCWVLNRESGGNINAYNPTGCGGYGCRGKWQCDPRTCSGTGTEEQQDAEARALWNGGRGCSNWGAC